MHLTGIKLSNIPPFTEPITLRFHERVNVFIGPNASGEEYVANDAGGLLLRESMGRKVPR